MGCLGSFKDGGLVMLGLKLESATDSFDLESVRNTGSGVQVLSGVTGLGLPPIDGHWKEGAGNGSTFRGRRVLAREIDLPLLVQGTNRADLVSLMSRLTIMLSGAMTLRLTGEATESDWTLPVYRIGGGSYNYGQDTNGEREVSFVVTLRAGDPFFTSAQAVTKVINSAGPNVYGDTALVNTGDADATPTWTITGPATKARLVSAKGEVLEWNGTLAAAETIVINVKAGTVVNSIGANKYSQLATAPRFWKILPGTTTANCTLTGGTSASSISVSWKPQKWTVI